MPIQNSKQRNKLRTVFIVPVSSYATKHKIAELERVYQKYGKMVQWFLTVFYKEGLDFRTVHMREAMDVVEKLCYRTKDRQDTKYNCKGAIAFPQSHYYYTAIAESIQKWSSFLTWKEKREKRGRPINKNFPEIQSYGPLFDSTMFSLDIGNGWITINSNSIKAGLNIPVSMPNKKRYNAIDSDKISSIRLCKNGDGAFVFHLIQSLDKPTILPSGKKSAKIVAFGIDPGERHLATVSSVELTPSDKLFRKVRRMVKFHDVGRAKQSAYVENHIRRSMQKNGKSRNIPVRSWHAGDIRKQEVLDVIHSILSDVKQHVRNGSQVFVFIGDLHAPAMRNKGSLSRRLSSYPRGFFIDILADCLRKLGVPVYLVNEYKTSKTCHTGCDSEDTFRRRGLFLCKSCGLQYDADANGSWNILGRGVRCRNIFPEILNKWVECALGAVP